MSCFSISASQNRVLRRITTVEQAGEFALAQTGDLPATPWFDCLFREQYPRAVALLARLTGDRGQAEEIAADVFCKLSRQRGLGTRRDEVLPWLYRVAMNAGLDALRSNARRRRREELAESERQRLAADSDALAGMLRGERRARVRTILELLKPRDAQLLLLRSDGLSYRELAETLGIHPASVGTLLARAEAEFERRYRMQFGDDV